MNEDISNVVCFADFELEVILKRFLILIKD